MPTAVYDGLTGERSRFVRVEDLVYAAAAAVPGLVPSRQEVAAEAALDQRDKDGVEIDQGIFLAHVLASERAGLHLCHAMLLPRPESAEAAAKFAARRRARSRPGAARAAGQGGSPHRMPTRASSTPRTTPRSRGWRSPSTSPSSIGASDIAVLRGGTVEHPKYRDRHVFGAGINLTHLYRGKIPFLWFIERDLGYVHKLLRGVARPEALPDDVHGRGIEKPWIAAVDTFAIGGHCQILLVAWTTCSPPTMPIMTLPARKEGIIPGLANLRLPRFTGDRIARQAIQYERKLACDSPEGRLICDEIVPAGGHGCGDRAGRRRPHRRRARSAPSATAAPSASAQEPLDLFRRYCSVYAREQAYCHFSPALIANLERNWDAKNRSM